MVDQVEHRRLRHEYLRRAVLILCVGATALVTSRAANGQRRGGLPNARYYLAMDLHYEGEYKESMRGFRSAAKGGIRSITGPWIDAICYYTMMGECHYQMGDPRSALQQYDAALKLYVAHPTWMDRVQFPPSLQPDNSAALRGVSWGTPSRPGQLARFPDSMQIFVGRINNELAVRQGGVVVAPELRVINVHEIVRCTALALRRRAEILGPVCPYTPVSEQLMAATSVQAAQPNQWSRPWTSIQRALVYLDSGRAEVARAELESSVLMAGQYFHPLSATALLELGKLALSSGEMERATVYLSDASLIAAGFEQADLVEEAMRLAVVAHMATNRDRIYPPLQSVAAWARRHHFDQLLASVLILAADNSLFINQTDQAKSLLSDARRAIGRNDMLSGKIGARHQFQIARLSFQQGDYKEGDANLKTVLTFQNNASLRQFQTAVADRRYTSGQIAARNAEELYQIVLRDPTTADWFHHPLDSLTYLMANKEAPLSHWFHAAMDRKQIPQAFMISERIKRERFMTNLPMGGRLLSLRWLLDGPEAILDKDELIAKQNILERFPEFQQLAKNVHALREALARIPLDSTLPGDEKKQSDSLDQLRQATSAQEMVLRQIAVSRQPSHFVFPRMHDSRQIQQALQAGELALAYFEHGRDMHAFMMSRDRYAHWKVPAASRLSRNISTMLRGIGNLDEHRPVAADLLTSDRWKSTAEAVLNQVIDEEQHGFWNRFDQLAVIPDGVLWQLPFEAIQVPTPEGDADLISEMQIRYLPLANLIVGDGRGQKPIRSTAIALGPGASASLKEPAELAKFSEHIPHPQKLPGQLPGPSGLYRCVWDQLVTFGDHAIHRRNPFGWSPALIDSGTSHSYLSRWIGLPWGGPDCIVLTGFETAASSSLKRGIDGDFIFHSVTGLLASGARTLLLSRWQTRGRTNIDLAREFINELPNQPAAAAWRRSVQLARATEIDPQQEPRIDVPPNQDPFNAEHPFLWAGYMLIDSHSRPPAPAIPNFAD